MLASAAAAPIEATGVGFAAELGLAPSAGGLRPVALDIDTASVTLKQVQGKWTGGIEVLFVQFEGGGKLLTSGGRSVPLSLTDDDREQWQRHGFVLNAPLQVRDGCEQLKIVIRDLTTGAIGTVKVPMRRAP